MCVTVFFFTNFLVRPVITSNGKQPYSVQELNKTTQNPPKSIPENLDGLGWTNQSHETKVTLSTETQLL